MTNSPFTDSVLADLYRFAVLLTGSIKEGEAVMAGSLAESAEQLAQMRSEPQRRAWFALRIREKCPPSPEPVASAPRLLREEAEFGEPLEILHIEAYLVAQRFFQLPEPERSALALFYLDLFSTDEIARLLKLPPEDLAETLHRARALLESQLRATRGAHS